MKSIETMEQLKLAIHELEDQDYVNQQFMKRRVDKIVDDLKPANLIRNMVRRVVKPTDNKFNILGLITGGKSFWGIAAGLATSFVAKKFFKKSL